MAIAIEIRYLWGRVHATPWGRHTNEGAVEWPPAPHRILRALYATWATRHPEIDEDRVIPVLEALATPPRYGTDPVRPGSTRHYLAGDGHTAGRYQRELAIDAFLSCRSDRGVIVEWDTDLDADGAEVLQSLAASVPFMGRADSLCQVSITSESVSDRPIQWAPLDTTVTAPDEVTDLLVPSKPLDVHALTMTPSQVRSSKRLQPDGSISIPYAATAAGDRQSRRIAARTRTRIPAVRYLLDGPALPDQRHTLSVAHLLRQAAIRRGPDGSATLSGKHPNGEPLMGQHGHAHYLVFASDPNDGRLDTAIVWAPDGFDDEEVRGLAQLRYLRSNYLKEIPAMRVILQGVGSILDLAPEITAPSTSWRTRTPFALTRYPKGPMPFGNQVAAQVERELEVRGIAPATIDVLSDASWRNFRRHRPDGRSMRSARPARHVQLTFDTPQIGPISLGAFSHFSLGLFVPTGN